MKKSASEYDNRIATIELIYKSSININETNLIQIILPAIFLDNPHIEDIIANKYKIKPMPLTYVSIKGTPNENFGSIYNSYLNFARLNNLV